MNSKISKVADSDSKKCLMLKCGKANNFIAWKLEQIEICAVEFGFQANIIKTNETYVPPAVTEADYMPPAAAAGAAITALTPAGMAALRLEAEKERNKEVRALKLSLPKFYATLMTSISPESKC